MTPRDLQEGAGSSTSSSESEAATGGFATKLAVPTERPAPVLQNPGYGSDGGTQGLEWYKSRLKQDQDGDIADQFLEEITAAAAPTATGPSLSLQDKVGLRARVASCGNFIHCFLWDMSNEHMERPRLVCSQS